ncbi:MAG: serine--tRNA ligase [Gemmatimonadales bacterium]|jgi:seryl-tRNA synthetase
MIDLKLLRESPDRVKAALARRGSELGPAVDAVLRLDERRRAILQQGEQLKAQRNKASEEVARRKREKVDADKLISELKSVSDTIKELDQELRGLEEELQSHLLQFPNLPMDDVPEGDESANVIVRSWGELPVHDFEPKPHWELGERLGILDLARGAKIAGSGFPLLTAQGAKLSRALVHFMIDLHTTEHDYTEVAPPFLVNADAARGTGQLPTLGDDMYVTKDGLYLIPTAEVPVTNIHARELLSADELPKGYVAYSPCFRREAGAAGKDTRGLIRVHQFDKVELVRLTRPDDSPTEHERLLGHAEVVLQRLEIPYRVVMLATADLGFASAKTYDLEVWAAGVGKWLEASSASTFTDFQARRASIRYRPEPGSKPEFVHTLNASGVALPRTIIALLENNQEEDGSVRIPDALRPYLGIERLTPRGLT